MPAYDFRCRDCDNKFTARVSISEKDTVKCPKCNSDNVKQIFTSVGLSVKSSGSSGGFGCGSSGFS